MTPEKIEVLREMTKNHEDFSKMSTYFFDNFAESKEFMKSGKEVKNPLIRAAIDALVEKFFTVNGKLPEIAGFFTIKYKDTDMFHGSLMTKNMNMITFYYFENDGIGLATIVKKFGGGTDFTRFSTKLTPENSFSGKHDFASKN